MDALLDPRLAWLDSSTSVGAAEESSKVLKREALCQYDYASHVVHPPLHSTPFWPTPSLLYNQSFESSPPMLSPETRRSSAYAAEAAVFGSARRDFVKSFAPLSDIPLPSFHEHGMFGDQSTTNEEAIGILPHAERAHEQRAPIQLPRTPERLIDYGQHRRREEAERKRMPPPSSVRRRLKERFARENDRRLPAARMKRQVKGEQEVRETIRAGRADLPPQFRSLYNSSTIEPICFSHFATTNIVSASPSDILLKRALSQKKIVECIAKTLNERDAVSFAMTCAFIYSLLDRTFWASYFTDDGKNTANLSAWAYMWPNSNGWCRFCLRWARIVMHEPSKAILCLDCIQLPTFKLIRFSEARTLYDLDDSIAQQYLSCLPSVQNAEATYYWISHIEWVQAQVRAAKGEGENLQMMCLSEAEKVFRQLCTPACRHTKDDQSCPRTETDVPPRDTSKHTRPRSSSTLVRIPLKGRSVNIKSSLLRETNSTESAERQEATTMKRDPITAAKENESSVQGTTDDVIVTRRTRSQTGTNPAKKVKWDLTTTDKRHRRIHSSSAVTEDLTNREARHERMLHIMRLVRQEHLEKELKAIGAEQVNTLDGDTADQFLNGQWSELQEQGIDVNDFKAMAQYLKSSGALTSEDGDFEFENLHDSENETHDGCHTHVNQE